MAPLKKLFFDNVRGLFPAKVLFIRLHHLRASITAGAKRVTSAVEEKEKKKSVPQNGWRDAGLKRAYARA